MNFLHPGSGIKAVRGSSISSSGSGYWAAMCNSNDNGSPTLPTTNAWWHVLSMDWMGNDTDVTNWCSQLALPTQDGSSLYWRRNDAGGTSINSSTWHKVIDDTNIGSQSVNYANSAGSAGSCSSISFSNNGQCYINAGGADCGDAIDSQACNIAIRSWWSIGFYDQCYNKYAISMNTRDGIVRAYTLRAENSSDKGLQLGSYHVYVG